METNPMDLKNLIEELRRLEELRVQNPLAGGELERWKALQRLLARAMCNFSLGAEERRSYVRVPCPAKVYLRWGDRSLEATAVDLGEGGMALKAASNPDVGELVDVVSASHETHGQMSLHVPAHIVWARPTGEFGISFTPEHRDHEVAVAKLLLLLLSKN